MASPSGYKLRLEPEDDYLHPLEEAENFNESMYFNVFDRDRKIGGWFRIANRPNEGKGEMTCCIYLPDGRIGFMFARPVRHDNDALDGGGMRVDVVEPLQRLDVTYSGKLCVLDNPQEMAEPAKAFKNNPIVKADIQLAFEGLSPMFGGEPVNEDGPKPAPRFFFQWSQFWKILLFVVLIAIGLYLGYRAYASVRALAARTQFRSIHFISAPDN